MSDSPIIDTLGRDGEDGAIGPAGGGYNKNLIINGDMSVNQRDATSPTGTSRQYLIDRWGTTRSSMEWAWVTDVPADTPFTRSLQVNRPGGVLGGIMSSVELTATGQAGIFRQGAELTLSFWARNTTALEARVMNVRIGFADDGLEYTNGVDIFPNATIGSTNTNEWAFFTHTFTVGVDPVSTSRCVSVRMEFGGSQAQDLQFTGVQLEVGAVATDFEYQHKNDMRALCQKYYEYGHTIFGPEVGPSPQTFSVKKRIPSGTMVAEPASGSGAVLTRMGNTGFYQSTNNSVFSTGGYRIDVEL